MNISLIANFNLSEFREKYSLRNDIVVNTSYLHLNCSDNKHNATAKLANEINCAETFYPEVLIILLHKTHFEIQPETIEVKELRRCKNLSNENFDVYFFYNHNVAESDHDGLLSDIEQFCDSFAKSRGLESSSCNLLIVPSVNTTMEHDFYKSNIKNILVKRILYIDDEDEIKAHERMNSELYKLSVSNFDIDFKSLIYGCTTGSFIGGDKYFKDFKSNLIKINHSFENLINASSCIIEKLLHTRISEVNCITPYNTVLNEQFKKYLEENGIKVNLITTIGTYNKGFEIGRENPSVIYSKILELKEALGSHPLLQACTDWKTLAVRSELEKKLHVDVFPVNYCLVEKVLEIK